ncbi:MAG: DUF4445 domain-containing protein [Propionivibrio sp.]|jgi:uncharacterized 2Fe-2S/4Fe-4S cluster protein (DUF4445 family)|uniref:ASKHA domain-containing protein n=1 Tax=Propionivibrio sp. TaxID=2212460 RepID=UPI001B678FC3|nr:ASKHA domain-containing protein [Propionivibrio sp.]MBP7204115.1 DUF4445 domain-containing protein [Propionivibrio sp.]MBP8214502.1 DUF4445 domain-containing protein [Propionivibrio sp.]
MKTCTVRAHAGQTILEALRGDHHAIDAPCGGRTRCIRCMVQVSDDSTQSPIVEPPSSEEGALVGQTRLADGWRLACRARLVTSGDISLKLPDGRLEIPDFPVRARKWSNAAQRTDGQFVIAIDIGTTTVAAILVDRTRGEPVGRVAEANLQRSWGADVIARIEHAISERASAQSMQSLIQAQLERMILVLCADHGLADAPPVFVCGNTAMLHLLEGEDVSGLARMPFRPVFLDSRITRLGKRQIPARLCASLSAFVGSDITAGLFACGLDGEVSAPRFLIDIGTNGEMALVLPGRILVTATAAGPAFEGENIACGSTAIAGAIDHVWVEDEAGGDGAIRFSSLDSENARPASICGSGLLDLIACLRQLEIIDEGGAFDTKEARFSFGEGLPYLTQGDVRQFQLAKGAIAAGIELLCKRAGVAFDEVETIYLAGGFGSTLAPDSALTVGLLPAAFTDRIEVAGNTALNGTVSLGVDPALFDAVDHIRQRVEVVDLAADPGFGDVFAANMLFPENDGDA